jgi:hypothetical protein
MCAAKKAAKKPKTAPKLGGRRFFGPNPLPAWAVGKRLLVGLHTEDLIEKLKLTDEWETPEGPEFDDLSAIVACAAGEDYMLPGDEERAARLKARLEPKLRKKIEANAAPKILRPFDGRNLKPAVYEDILTLGLGHKCMPIDPNETQVDGLALGLAVFMKMDRGRVIERTFERAKRKIYMRFLTHLSKQALRIGMPRILKAKAAKDCPEKSNAQIFQEVACRLYLMGKLKSLKHQA